MTLAFVLTMPGNNSWNGRWSGEAMLFADVRNLGNSQAAAKKGAELDGQHFGYSWSDGWRASISVKVVDAAEARRLRKASRGFMGYGWMVDDILAHGEIREPEAVR